MSCRNLGVLVALMFIGIVLWGHSRRPPTSILIPSARLLAAEFRVPAGSFAPDAGFSSLAIAHADSSCVDNDCGQDRHSGAEWHDGILTSISSHREALLRLRGVRGSRLTIALLENEAASPALSIGPALRAGASDGAEIRAFANHLNLEIVGVELRQDVPWSVSHAWLSESLPGSLEIISGLAEPVVAKVGRAEVPLAPGSLVECQCGGQLYLGTVEDGVVESTLRGEGTLIVDGAIRNPVWLPPYATWLFIFAALSALIPTIRSILGHERASRG